MLDTTPRDQVTVEAETVEDALAEISAEFGEDAEIMRAQKVHRGGVGGFFAKEMVQLTARRRQDAAPKLRPRPENNGIADVLERMAQDADAEDSDFRTVLQREMSAESAPTNAAEFLAAVGWDEGQEVVGAGVASDEVVSDDSDQFVPPFAETDALPEPVAVGPALRSVPESAESVREEEVIVETVASEEIPADAVSGDTSTVVEGDALDEPVVPAIAEDDVVAEPDGRPEASDPEPVAGPVVPIHDPDSGLDEAATLEPVEAVDHGPAPEAVTAAVGKVVADAIATTELISADAAETAAVENPSWWRTAQPMDAPDGMGAVSWSTTALLRLGLPAPVLNAVGGIDNNDDLGWIDAISAAVAPHCGPLPAEDVIVVGPHAERLAEPLGLPLIRSGDMAPYDGSFCAMVEDTPEDRNWLEFVRGGRGIHLVVGDEPWQDLLIDEPVAVSWVGETAVADALYLAFTLGATLGFGTVDGFVSSMVRAQPTDVALAVRRIVGRK